MLEAKRGLDGLDEQKLHTRPAAPSPAVAWAASGVCPDQAMDMKWFRNLGLEGLTGRYEREKLA